MVNAKKASGGSGGSLQSFARTRHALYDFTSMTSVHYDAGRDLYSVLHSTALTKSSFVMRRGASGCPSNGNAIACLMAFQGEMDKLARRGDAHNMMIAETGAIFITRLLNILGEKLVSCQARPVQGKQAVLQLNESYRMLKDFSESPDQAFNDTFRFLSALNCKQARAGG